MIADSSTLIIFAKVNRLGLLNKLYNNIHITEGVYDEAIGQGLLINASDALIIKDLFDSGKIILDSLDEKHLLFSKKLRGLYFQLGRGESEIISLALQKNKKSILIDEAFARKIAELYRIKPIGSLRILLNSFNNKIINEKELREVINQMINNKFRIGADVLDEFLNIFEKIKRRKKR